MIWRRTLTCTRIKLKFLTPRPLPSSPPSAKQALFSLLFLGNVCKNFQDKAGLGRPLPDLLFKPLQMLSARQATAHVALVQTSKQGPLRFSLASGMRTKVAISHSALEPSHRLLAGQTLRYPSGLRNCRTHGDSAGFESPPVLTVICGLSSHGAVRLLYDLVIAGYLKVHLVCLELSEHLETL